MLRILPLFCTGIAACIPSLQEAVMYDHRRTPGSAAGTWSEADVGGSRPAGPTVGDQGGGDRGRDRSASLAAPGPASATVGQRPDLPVEGQGRRILSTAFVMVGPDGHLTVELRDGRVLVLRDVVMRRRDYCGVQVLGAPPGAPFCGGYADVAAARSGGAAVSRDPAVLDPPEPTGRGD